MLIRLGSAGISGNYWKDMDPFYGMPAWKLQTKSVVSPWVKGSTAHELDKCKYKQSTRWLGNLCHE